jgi:hypothetical protein
MSADRRTGDPSLGKTSPGCTVRSTKQGLSPRIVADSPFGANHPKPYPPRPLWTGLPNNENKNIRKQEFQIILEDGTLARF